VSTDDLHWPAVIKSYRHKGLRELADKGESRKVAPDLQSRIVRRLDALKAARQHNDMNIPGFNFHPLHGKPLRYSVHVNGPWCLTFGWEDDSATDVDLEQYH
jgi:proteic killer suppression protein